MKKYLFIKFMVGFLSISVWLITGCVGISHAGEKSTKYLSSKKNFLTDKQIKSLDTHAAKTLPECGFVYGKESVGTVTGDAIYQCIEGVSRWFGVAGYKILGFSYEQSADFHGKFYNLKHPSGISDIQLSRFHELDDYLGKRVLPYVLAIPKLDQEVLLRKILMFHSGNLVFIKTMMDKGVSVRNVLLSQIGEGGHAWASCESFLLILNKNIGLYKDKKTLNEPVPSYEKGEHPSYRWKDIFHLTDFGYNICPEAIKRLVQANPDELLNKRLAMSEGNPLHNYLAGVDMSRPESVPLIKMLTTPINVNMKSKWSGTPLHGFLSNIATRASSQDKHMITWFIEQGANINLKNAEGVTVKDLILKSRPDLSGVLK